MKSFQDYILRAKRKSEHFGDPEIELRARRDIAVYRGSLISAGVESVQDEVKRVSELSESWNENAAAVAESARISKQLDMNAPDIVLSLYREIEYLEHKNIAVAENGLTIGDMKRIAEKVKKCGSSGVYKRSVESGEVRRVLRHSCGKTKICPICADREYMRRFGALAAWYEENKENVDSAYFLTFTQKKIPGESPRDAARRILSAFRSWQRIGQKNRGGEYEKIMAGFRSLEIEPTIEFSDSGKPEVVFHAHLHGVFFTSDPLDYEVYNREVKKQVLEEWREEQKRKTGKRPRRGEMMPKKVFAWKMEKRGGYLNPFKTSKLSAEWGRAGLGNKSIRADVLFTADKKPETLFSGIEKKKTEVQKKIRYSLKYSVKNGDWNAIPRGELFRVLDAMQGMRKNEYIGGVGEYEHEPEPEQESGDSWEYLTVNNERGAVVDQVEKISRELFTVDRGEMDRKLIQEIHEYQRKRRLWYTLYKHRYITEKQYEKQIENSYKTMKGKRKTIIEQYRAKWVLYLHCQQEKPEWVNDPVNVEKRMAAARRIIS